MSDREFNRRAKRAGKGSGRFAMGFVCFMLGGLAVSGLDCAYGVGVPKTSQELMQRYDLDKDGNLNSEEVRQVMSDNTLQNRSKLYKLLE